MISLLLIDYKKLLHALGPAFIS